MLSFQWSRAGAGKQPAELAALVARTDAFKPAPADAGAARLASLLRSSTASTSSLEGRKDQPQKPHLRAAPGLHSHSREVPLTGCA
jgi:hypothetical protein